MDGIPLSRCWRRIPAPLRRSFAALALSVCLLLALRAYCLEPFQVPTGSMAPTLLGHHRSAVCLRCGFEVDVGRTHADRDGAGGTRCYAQVSCPNCGSSQCNLGETTEARGDHVLVNKLVYGLRRPRRWEVIVFRLNGKTFIKRLIGLGGEEIELVDGDVYIDGKLARKTFDEFLGMRALVFDNDFAPKPDGWRERWEYQPEHAPDSGSAPLALDGRDAPQHLIYRNFSLDERKCVPLTDEYAYNGGKQRSAEPVHDFMAEAEVEVVAGSGALSFALNDGGLEAEVQLKVGATEKVKGTVKPLNKGWPANKAWPGLRYSETPVTATPCVRSHEPGLRSTSDPATPTVIPRGETTPPGPPFVRGGGIPANLQNVQLLAGKCYHIEIALVDRRLTMRVDGRDVFSPLDLPEAKERDPVDRPLRFTASGVLARLHHVRLYRDVHYTQAGKNGVRGRAAHLGIDQTFVLGDNSPNSEDSRFWPNQGAVPLDSFVGRAFLVHLPSRAATWQALGRQGRYQLPDWERIRWLR